MTPIDRPVVLVVDMQHDILRGRLALPAVAEQVPVVIPAIARIVDAAHARAVPVVFTRIAFRPGHVDANPESPARRLGYGLLDGDPGTDIVEELRPGSVDHVVTKKRASAFFGTDLEVLLRGLGARSLIVTGGTTNRAVESTIRDAHAHDYHAIVVADATVGISAALHEGALRSIADFFGEVATTDQVVAALSDHLATVEPARQVVG